MGDLEWTNALVIRLMEQYRQRPELWDSNHEMYRVQTLKYETWRDLANIFECDIADLRKKLNSLFASHRREKAKIRAGGKSTWFLYPYMSFLPTHLESEYGESGSQSASKPSSTTKRRPPVKEADPPASSEDDRDQDEEMVESPSVQEEVLIKTEPAPEPVRPRMRRNLTHKPRLTRPIKRRIPKETYGYKEKDKDALDTRLTEALKLLRKAEFSRQKDECDSFGEYIADSLRKHDERTQSMIKQAINNILFEQEMKKYSTSQYTVVIAGIDENPLILSEPDATDK